jgi:hypothetical protein
MRALKAHEDRKGQNEKLSHSSTSLLLLKMWVKKLDGAPVTSVDGGSLPHEVKMAKEKSEP